MGERGLYFASSDAHVQADLWGRGQAKKHGSIPWGLAHKVGDDHAYLPSDTEAVLGNLLSKSILERNKSKQAHLLTNECRVGRWDWVAGVSCSSRAL